MGKLESITLGLPSEQIGLLREAVRSGQYESVDVLVTEALLEWHLRRTRAGEPAAERLGMLWDEGKASGEPAPVDMAELREEARRRARISF
jgi:Arc/MetJ-type ribon-helix-helix transcriptional regulator